MDKIVLGIDIGGSHITAALVNLETRSILPGSLTRGNVNSQGTVKEIIDEWCSTIRRTLDSHKSALGKVGIAMPGPFNYKVGISKIRDQNKYDALYGLNVKELLASELGVSVKAIQFVNDAECFLGGETFCGAARDCKSALGLTLGTGLGTAWYRNEVSEDAALWSYPFKDGIAEDYLATKWFISRYNELSGRTVKNVRELADIADTDPDAKIVFSQFGENLSQFLELLIRQYKPEVIVIGGNIAKAYDLFSQSLLKHLIEQKIDVEIRRAMLGEDAALIGAATYWDQRIYDGV